MTLSEERIKQFSVVLNQASLLYFDYRKAPHGRSPLERDRFLLSRGGP